MLVRLFKSNVVKNVFPRRSALAFRSLACHINPFRPIVSSCFPYPVVGKLENSRQFGGAARSPLAAVYQVNSVRGIGKLFVGDLPEDASEQLVHQHFSKFGEVLSTKIVKNTEEMEPGNSAFVIFYDKESFNKAMDSDSHVISNKQVVVRPSPESSFVVLGLPPFSTEKSMHDYFSRFGRVVRCDVRRNWRNELVGFVDFWHLNELDQGLASQVHVIDGIKVDVEPCFPKELFLRLKNLSPSTTVESLTSFYSAFGTLLHASVGRNKETGESRGSGTVCFSSEQEVVEALRSMPHIIDGKEIVVIYRSNELVLFVAQLPPDLSEQRLKEYFEQYGTVYRCDIAVDKVTNLRLPYGWLYFSSLQEKQNALAERPHVIDGKPIAVLGAKSPIADDCCLFVGGLSYGTTDQMLYDFFSKFGSLTKWEVKRDRTSGRSMGFGFIGFSSVDEASRALRAGRNVIDGRVVSVKPRMLKPKNISSMNHSYAEKSSY